MQVLLAIFGEARVSADGAYRQVTDRISNRQIWEARGRIWSTIRRGWPRQLSVMVTHSHQDPAHASLRDPVVSRVQHPVGWCVSGQLRVTVEKADQLRELR